MKTNLNHYDLIYAQFNNVRSSKRETISKQSYLFRDNRDYFRCSSNSSSKTNAQPIEITTTIMMKITK